MRSFVFLFAFIALIAALADFTVQPDPRVLQTLEDLKKVGMKPEGFTRLGTPLFDQAEFTRRMQDLKYACTEGACCDLTKKRFKEWGEACTPDASTPCQRPANYCLGGSNTCQMENMEDDTICPGGKCMSGKCVIANCDKGCCNADNTALPKGTKCSNGTCNAGKCLPENVKVLQTNFLEDNSLTKPSTVNAANEFDTEAYNTQVPKEDTISPEDKKIYNRIDSILDKFNSKKNSDLKLILKGISDKEKRRAESLKKSEAAKAKKTAAFEKEVEEQKQRYAALEKLDKAQY